MHTHTHTHTHMHKPTHTHTHTHNAHAHTHTHTHTHTLSLIFNRYYLQYKNVRPEYLKQIWGVVNWKDVAARYAAAKK